MSAPTPWWRGAVVYQIYIRSFCDGNGDGVGDFAGLQSKLDYIASLGVDAIWLSPIHPSPNRDWGYDVSDYEGVHPAYGNPTDFQRLLDAAHRRGLKVLTDEVLAHTSDEHAWFRESLKGGEKAEWYVWAPPRVDGTVPNNWLSAFAGPAWSYHPARRQYYHHKFLRQQPKLNWRNPTAKQAALAVLDFWLSRGVDGFRLDVANAYFHDVALADNPAVPMAERTPLHWAHAPNLQHHFHDSNLADNIEALDAIRRAVERYPHRFVMGEFSEDPERCGCFAAPDKGLHSGYSFPLLVAHKLSPEFVRAHYATLARYPAHWPSVAFSNHDVVRTPTRFGGPDAPPALAQLMLALLLCLKGTVLLYQGEELGLPQVDLRRDQLKDPVGDLYYPLSKGRDGCRTPMPWDETAPYLGFSESIPWLPTSESHRILSVSAQESRRSSTLQWTRRALAARRASKALCLGEIEFLEVPAPLLAFLRTCENETACCVFNMGAADASFVDSRTKAAAFLLQSPGVRQDAHELVLPPYGAAILSI